MVKLVRRAGLPYFFINGELEKTVIEALDDTISYFVENYERTDKFQSGQWDGKERLLRRAKNGSYYFPFGLIDRVLRILRLYSVSYFISDETSAEEPDYPMQEEIGKIKLRKYQVDALNHLMERCHNSSGVIALPTAAGKCHGKGTKIRMFDGSIKLVEDIKVGDLLMGPDSNLRTVMSLARGIDELYEIIPKKGDSWTCNKSHVLSLQATATDGRIKKNQIINVPLDDYLKKSKTFKHLMKLWRVGVEYDYLPVELDPYILGVWLGDGTKKIPSITNSDVEIIDCLYKFASENALELREELGNNTITYHIKSVLKGGYAGKNKFRNFIKTCVIDEEKRIPREYLINSREIRLQLLAGLLDTDGYLDKGGYEIITKYNGLKDDIIELANSLGFFASSKIKIGKIKSSGFVGSYFRIHISGDIWNIPLKVPRKIHDKDFRQKNTLRCGFDVKSIGIGEYYGFTLDCDNLYLLHDFTVTHNTVMALAWLEHLKTDCVIIVHRKELLNQWYDEILRLTSIKKEEIGLVNDTFCDLGGKVEKKRVYICMVQSLFNAIQKGEIKDINVGLLVLDECHTIPAKGAYYVCSKINALYRLGLSATPHRSDNAELKIFAACGTIAENITVEDLVEQGYITKPEFRMINCYAKGLRGWDRWTDVYKKGIVLNENRNAEIVYIAEEHNKEGRQVYIHVSQVAHGKHLQILIEGSVFVYGSTPKKEREEIIKQYKNGEIRILISTLLKEGVSIDGISCLIYAQGMKSEVATIQTIGRALRLDPAFNDALIYDFIDSGHKHLVEHSEQRIATYREVYGKLFNY